MKPHVGEHQSCWLVVFHIAKLRVVKCSSSIWPHVGELSVLINYASQCKAEGCQLRKRVQPHVGKKKSVADSCDCYYYYGLCDFIELWWYNGWVVYTFYSWRVVFDGCLCLVAKTYAMKLLFALTPRVNCKFHVDVKSQSGGLCSGIARYVSLLRAEVKVAKLAVVTVF